MADDRVLAIFEELKQLHIDKDEDYGGGESLSNFQLCESFGVPAWKGSLIRMSDKFSRIVSLMKKNGMHSVAGEALDDTLKDIAIYAIITLALKERK